jgi:hypothetical protein
VIARRMILGGGQREASRAGHRRRSEVATHRIGHRTLHRMTSIETADGDHLIDLGGGASGRCATGGW